jgi:ABC-type transporter Mla MlaB component
MNISGEQAFDKDVLFFSGDLTEEHAEKIWVSLFTALSKTDCVELNLEGVTDVDLSCIEPLCLAQRMAMKLNKRLVITGRRPERLIRIFAADGFPYHAFRCRDCGDSCFWNAS